MESEEREYCQRLKRHAFRNGLDLIGLSIHQDSCRRMSRRVIRTSPHASLSRTGLSDGIPCLRLNSGRWKTVDTFDQLMALRGDEPPLPGYTDDDAFSWCLECIAQCLQPRNRSE